MGKWLTESAFEFGGLSLDLEGLFPCPGLFQVETIHPAADGELIDIHEGDGFLSPGAFGTNGNDVSNQEGCNEPATTVAAVVPIECSARFAADWFVEIGHNSAFECVG